MNDPYFNEVLLCGKLAGPPRTTPAVVATALLEWRLTVPAPSPDDPAATSTFPCATHNPDLLEPGRKWPPGSLLEIRGTLRRQPHVTPNGLRLVRIYVDADEADLVPEPPF
ncbi:hypothetical protein GCM10027589_33550 [Actinocorallia lasiicapitis]